MTKRTGSRLLAVLLLTSSALLEAQAPNPASSRPQWEYAFVECIWMSPSAGGGVMRVFGPQGQIMETPKPGTSPIVFSARLGADGWELTGTLQGANIVPQNRQNAYTIIFKRLAK